MANIIIRRDGNGAVEVSVNSEDAKEAVSVYNDVIAGIDPKKAKATKHKAAAAPAAPEVAAPAAADPGQPVPDSAPIPAAAEPAEPATPPAPSAPAEPATPPAPAAQAPAAASTDDPIMVKAKQLLGKSGGEEKLMEALGKVGATAVSAVPSEHKEVFTQWLDHYLAQ